MSIKLTLAMILFGLSFPTQTRADVVVNDVIPFAQVVLVPCANGGAGELVLISGNLHILITSTVDNNGGTQDKNHAQPQGATGVGLTTGDVYRATGVTQDQVTINGAGEFTFVNNFRIIGPGPGNNLLVHQTVHVTINANGDMTVDVDNSSVECR
jgi:hypothetical protein